MANDKRGVSGHLNLSPVCVVKQKYTGLYLSKILVFVLLAAIFLPLHLTILTVSQTIPKPSNISA